jgi:hypothetical protein
MQPLKFARFALPLLIIIMTNRVIAVIATHLGRHVGRRPDLRRFRELALFQKGRHVIADLRSPVGLDDDVRRFDFAMDDPLAV